MINQLFVEKPPDSLILSCIKLLGWTSLTDKRVLIRTDLDDLQIAARFTTLMNDIKRYYLPCKQEKYLSTMNTKAIITIVRQLLKTMGYNIRGIERVMDNKKEMIYKLELYKKMKPITQQENKNFSSSNTVITTTPTTTQNGKTKFIVCWN